jgi:hypothetical protein
MVDIGVLFPRKLTEITKGQDPIERDGVMLDAAHAAARVAEREGRRRDRRSGAVAGRGASSHGTLWACDAIRPSEQRPPPLAGRFGRPTGRPIFFVLRFSLKLLGRFIARNRLQLHHHHQSQAELQAQVRTLTTQNRALQRALVLADAQNAALEQWLARIVYAVDEGRQQETTR